MFLNLDAILQGLAMVDQRVSVEGNSCLLCEFWLAVDHPWEIQHRCECVWLLSSHKPVAILIQVLSLVRIGSTMNSRCKGQNHLVVVLVDSKAKWKCCKYLYIPICIRSKRKQWIRRSFPYCVKRKNSILPAWAPLCYQKSISTSDSKNCWVRAYQSRAEMCVCMCEQIRSKWFGEAMWQFSVFEKFLFSIFWEERRKIALIRIQMFCLFCDWFQFWK